MEEHNRTKEESLGSFDNYFFTTRQQTVGSIYKYEEYKMSCLPYQLTYNTEGIIDFSYEH